MTVIDGAIVVPPGQGAVLLKDRWWLPLRSADTPGGMMLMDVVLPPGARATRLHVHHQTDEVWYILEGRITFFLGERLAEAGTGSCVVVPRGVLHGLHNASTEAVRYLVMCTPGQLMEGYFRELGALIDATPAGPPDPVKFAAIAATYDTAFHDPPAHGVRWPPA